MTAETVTRWVVRSSTGRYLAQDLPGAPSCTKLKDAHIFSTLAGAKTYTKFTYGHQNWKPVRVTVTIEEQPQ